MEPLAFADASLPRKNRKGNRLWIWGAAGAAFLLATGLGLCFVDAPPTGWTTRFGEVRFVEHSTTNSKLNVRVDGREGIVLVEGWERVRFPGPELLVDVHPGGPRIGVRIHRPWGDWYYRTYLWGAWGLFNGFRAARRWFAFGW